jgi:hypothetical protein
MLIMTIKEQFWEDWETLVKNAIIVYIVITKNEIERREVERNIGKFRF